MNIPSARDIPPLAVGVTVHVETSHALPCRWGAVVCAYGIDPAKNHTAGMYGPIHTIRLDNGQLINAPRSILCPIFALPVSGHCRGRWDFHPPARGLM